MSYYYGDEILRKYAFPNKIVGDVIPTLITRKCAIYECIVRLGYEKYTTHGVVVKDRGDFFSKDGSIWATPDDIIESSTYKTRHEENIKKVRFEELKSISGKEIEIDNGFEYEGLSIYTRIIEEEIADYPIQYISNQLINGIIFIEEIEPYIFSKEGEIYYLLKNIRRGKFECPYCTNVFEARIGAIKHGYILSCGCLHRRKLVPAPAYCSVKDYNKNPIYKIWENMIGKCYDPLHPEYANYGRKGIYICEEWIDNFDLFYSYVTKLKNFDYELLEDSYGMFRLYFGIINFWGDNDICFIPAKYDKGKLQRVGWYFNRFKGLAHDRRIMK